MAFHSFDFRFVKRVFLLALFIIGANLLVQSASAQTTQIRVAYLICSDRSPQSGAVSNLQLYLPTVRDWFAEQMDRFGFGEKTFRYETESDGVTPKVHVVQVSATASQVRADPWPQALTAASNAGVPIWGNGQVWIVIPECHEQQSNGSVLGSFALGGSFGSGTDPGVAMIGSDALFRLDPNRLLDGSNYHGQVIPQIGPYALVQDVSFWWFEGSTISSISSAVQGAIAHELGHALGLGHDFRNDSNYRGNLMGNGLRGWRGSLLPNLFPMDDVQLSYSAALALNSSRYFNSNAATDQIRPTLSISTSGFAPLENGKLRINFSCSDGSGLSAALLFRNGDVIGELPLSGTNVSSAFLTPYFTAGQAADFTVRVYDINGNTQTSAVNITPQSGVNVAPQPFLAASPTTIAVGQILLLNASNSSDPNNPIGQLQFAWDIEGDGTYTVPSSQSTYQTTFDSVGSRLVSVRVSDPQGAWSISTPLAIRVIAPGSEIASSHVYYAGSEFASGSVDAALDFSKTLAREGSESQTLGFENLINAKGGIRGLVFDIQDLPVTTLTVDDFSFQVSPQGAYDEQANPPTDWPPAPNPESISVVAGATPRAIIEWSENSISNRWLRITVKANSSTGLLEPAVFYIGHLLGETTGLSGSVYTTSFSDIGPIRAVVGTTVSASSIADIDKNGIVSFADISAMRSNVGSQLTNITIQSE